MKLLVGLRNHVYADFIAYNLRLLGHDVKVVKDGLEIVNTLFAQKWDGAIIGIHVDYYNGLEILDKYQQYCLEKQKKQEDFVKAKIIIGSSFYDKLSLEQTMNLGAIDYFVVPMNTNDLLNKIQKIESL